MAMDACLSGWLHCAHCLRSPSAPTLNVLLRDSRNLQPVDTGAHSHTRCGAAETLFGTFTGDYLCWPPLRPLSSAASGVRLTLSAMIHHHLTTQRYRVDATPSSPPQPLPRPVARRPRITLSGVISVRAGRY